VWACELVWTQRLEEKSFASAAEDMILLKVIKNVGLEDMTWIYLARFQVAGSRKKKNLYGNELAVSKEGGDFLTS
jgi:hypothetical protein